MEIAFTAPGDDGTDGVVAGYEIRRVVKADANAAVTIAEWDAASASSLIVNDTTASGGPVTINISGVGPGSTTGAHGPLAAGLVPNQLHTLAVAAIDDATDLDAGASHPRLGAISDITVDLRWRSETPLTSDNATTFCFKYPAVNACCPMYNNKYFGPFRMR